MSETKHTPGPWLVKYAETRVRWPVIYVKDDTYEDGEHEIAEINDHVAQNINTSIKPQWVAHPDKAEGEANARLIAAAPDLLAACRVVKAHIEELREAWQTGALTEHDGRGGERSNRNVDLDVLLHNVISKSEGRS
jgi:hypothetical protein